MKTHFWIMRPGKASFSVHRIMPTLSSYLGGDSLQSKKKKSNFWFKIFNYSIDNLLISGGFFAVVVNNNTLL